MTACRCVVILRILSECRPRVCNRSILSAVIDVFQDHMYLFSGFRAVIPCTIGTALALSQFSSQAIHHPLLLCRAQVCHFKEIFACLKEKLIKMFSMFFPICFTRCFQLPVYFLHIFAWVVCKLEYVVADFLVSMHKLYVKL